MGKRKGEGEGQLDGEYWRGGKPVSIVDEVKVEATLARALGAG